MSEVKRYYWNADSLDGLGYGSLDLLADASSQELVEGADFDRITADRDAALGREAALREELKTSRAAFKEELDGVKYTRRRFRQERDQLQQRLTVADEWADVLEGLLREWCHLNRSCLYGDILERTDAALKAAEAIPDFSMIGTEPMPPMEYDEP